MVDKKILQYLVDYYTDELKRGNIKFIYQTFTDLSERERYTSEFTKILLSAGYTPEQIYEKVGSSYAYFFANNDLIKKITIPGKDEYIASYAFQNCPNLEEVIIEEGIYQIGACCFKNCPKLKDIYIPVTISQINLEAFKGCEGCTFHIDMTEDNWENVFIEDAFPHNCKFDFLR